MNCKNLTDEEAFDLCKNYMDKGNNLQRAQEDWEKSVAKRYPLPPTALIQYSPSTTHVDGEFRGFLYGGHFTLYIGDISKCYWPDERYADREFTLTQWDVAVLWKDKGINDFHVPHMLDITELICESQFDAFINWPNENPLEGK